MDKAGAMLTDISIHSPHTGRDYYYVDYACMAEISIHSPHTGRDPKCGFVFEVKQYFNPLSPHGERPGAWPPAPPARCISIHSPHTGRDCMF